MKILISIVHATGWTGGPTTNMLRLIPQIVRCGHVVEIVQSGGEKSDFCDYMEADFGIRCHRLGKGVTTRNHVKWLLKVVHEVKPDIFVANSSIHAFHTTKYIKMCGVPVVAFHRSNDSFHWRMVDDFVRGSEAHAFDGLVCVAKSIQEKVGANNPNNVSLAYVPSGVPLAHELSKQGVGDDVRVCYIGRLEVEQKQFRLTAEALFRNFEKGVVSHVGIIGGGNEMRWLKEQVEKRGLSHRVSIHGHVPPDELHELLKDYQISVLLSEYEGTPGAVMDAMSCGLNVIATKHGDGTEELIEEGITGHFCVDREESFDQVLSRVVYDVGLRKSVSQNARRLIEEKYSLEKTAERFLDFLSLFTRRDGLMMWGMPVRIDLLPNCEPYRQNGDLRKEYYILKLKRSFQRMGSLAKRWLKKGR